MGRIRVSEPDTTVNTPASGMRRQAQQAAQAHRSGRPSCSGDRWKQHNAILDVA